MNSLSKRISSYSDNINNFKNVSKTKNAVITNPDILIISDENNDTYIFYDKSSKKYIFRKRLFNGKSSPATN